MPRLPLLLLPFLLSGCLAINVTEAAPWIAHEAEAADDSVDWLFLHTAERMRVEGDDLVLEGAPGFVQAFSDRPHRLAAALPVDGFIALWSPVPGGFGDVPPNAGLTWVDETGMHVTEVELLDLRRDGERLVYRFRPLRTPPRDGAQVSVFIDAFPTAVNAQITDSVTQANVKVLGDAPAVAMGNLYQATAQSLGNAAHNATSAEQNSNTVLQATTTQGVALLYNVDTAATGVARASVFNEPDE
jgi:hypothetical protein